MKKLDAPLAMFTQNCWRRGMGFEERSRDDEKTAHSNPQQSLSVL
jgi:hypothetical protein